MSWIDGIEVMRPRVLPVRECRRIRAGRDLRALQAAPTTPRLGSCRLAVCRGIDMAAWRNPSRYVTAEALHARSVIVQYGRACGLHHILTSKTNPPTLQGPLRDGFHWVAEERSDHQDRSEHRGVWSESANAGCDSVSLGRDARRGNPV